MKKLKNVTNLLLFLPAFLGIIAVVLILPLTKQIFSSEEAPASIFSAVESETLADGYVVAKNKADLHFVGSGQLIYLPFAEGDSVQKGQIIAGIDATQAQKDVSATEASYRSAKAALDKILDDIHLFQYGNGGFANVGTANETQDQKTKRQQAEEAVNIAYDKLQQIKKTLENTAIVSPINGTLIHEDITITGVNITPTATFTVGDLNELVFQAQVSDNDISLIKEGKSVQIKLSSSKERQFSGTITKIYPEKIKLSSNGTGYKVDIKSKDLSANARLGATGSIIIQNAGSKGVAIPSWLILNHQYVWVLEDSTPKLKQIKIGDEKNGVIEILEGLGTDDKIINNPQKVISNQYQII